MTAVLAFEQVAKNFTLHVQGGVRIPVFEDVSFAVEPGECLVLAGPSGAGKSTLLRLAYGNYRAHGGRIPVRHREETIDLVQATPHQVLDIRRHTIGWVSQFLRVIPRVPALDIVSEPLRARGVEREVALEQARLLLTRLRVPETLWSLSPLTFSGGEQQRVNIARGFAAEYPVMLLDEPTASLDKENRQTVIEMIAEARNRGAAMLGIFHDADVREAVGTRQFDVAAVRSAEAA